MRWYPTGIPVLLPVPKNIIRDPVDVEAETELCFISSEFAAENLKPIAENIENLRII